MGGRGQYSSRLYFKETTYLRRISALRFRAPCSFTHSKLPAKCSTRLELLVSTPFRRVRNDAYTSQYGVVAVCASVVYYQYTPIVVRATPCLARIYAVSTACVACLNHGTRATYSMQRNVASYLRRFDCLRYSLPLEGKVSRSDG